MCDHVYIGETGRNAYSRGLEHQESLNRKDEKSPLWRHATSEHNGNTPRFTMTVTGSYRADPTLRQITESININRVPDNTLMNTRAEWHTTPLTRVVLTNL